MYDSQRMMVIGNVSSSIFASPGFSGNLVVLMVPASLFSSTPEPTLQPPPATNIGHDASLGNISVGTVHVNNSTNNTNSSKQGGVDDEGIDKPEANSNTTTVVAAVASVCGIVVLMCAGVALCLWRKRGQRRHRNNYGVRSPLMTQRDGVNQVQARNGVLSEGTEAGGRNTDSASGNTMSVHQKDAMRYALQTSEVHEHEQGGLQQVDNSLDTHHESHGQGGELAQATANRGNAGFDTILGGFVFGSEDLNRTVTPAADDEDSESCAVSIPRVSPAPAARAEASDTREQCVNGSVLVYPNHLKREASVFSMAVPENNPPRTQRTERTERIEPGLLAASQHTRIPSAAVQVPGIGDFRSSGMEGELFEVLNCVSDGMHSVGNEEQSLAQSPLPLEASASGHVRQPSALDSGWTAATFDVEVHPVIFQGPK